MKYKYLQMMVNANLVLVAHPELLHPCLKAGVQQQLHILCLQHPWLSQAVVRMLLFQCDTLQT